MMPLDMLRAGETAIITAVAGDAAWVGRLAAMGVQEGCSVCVLQPGSPCVVNVNGNRLCLRNSEGCDILVRPTQ